MKQYALYKGDQYLFGGTMNELADYLGVSIETARFYSSKVWKKRKHQIEIIKLEE